MLDIAWPELVVIGAVALVAIGPKDLPKAMHMVGKWVGKARGFARDVHRAMEQVSYEAEVAEKLKKTETVDAKDGGHTPLHPSSEGEAQDSTPHARHGTGGEVGHD